MNRRSFISMLGVAAASAAAPIYFDVGKNLWRKNDDIFWEGLWSVSNDPSPIYRIVEMDHTGDFVRIYKTVLLGMGKIPAF